MKIVKAFKYRLKTNPAIEKKLSQTCGCVRLIWNKALAIQNERLEKKEKPYSYSDLCKTLVTWKETNEFSFLKKVPSQSLQQTLKNLSRAMFEGLNKSNVKELPVFKKKGKHNSFLYPQGFKIESNRVFLPKIGWARFFKNREIEGTPKNLTVSKQGGHWFISIQVELEIKDPIHQSNSIVGIDMGIANFATLSDGTFIVPLNSFKKLEKKLVFAQRKLSRKVKFSQNWKKQKHKINLIHTKIANARKDFQHKTSTMISKNHAIIVMEDLKVSNMSKSAKGTKKSPGKNVKAKSGLNKSILDQGWGEFRRQLEYKQMWRGGQVLLIPPKNTSRTCPKCSFVSKENRLTQAQFQCKECGFKEHADIVGATNILAAGHAVLARGERTLVFSMKREPSVSAIAQWQ